MIRRWLPRRPSPTFRDLGAPLGDAFEAPDRTAAERIAILRYGRPVMVELLAGAGAQIASEAEETGR